MHRICLVLLVFLVAAAHPLRAQGAATPAKPPATAKPADAAARARADSVTRALVVARTRGSATAPVTVYEMSDFQCPFCRRFALETFPALEERYVKTGKVRWVFIHLPISDIHPNAIPAAEVSMCAAKQGKFWPMHDVLFRTQKVWAPLKEPGQFFLTLADSVGVEKSALRSCASRNEMQAEVEADAVGANRAGAASTPSFYIEGGLLVGAQPQAVFVQILDSIIGVRTAAKKP